MFVVYLKDYEYHKDFVTVLEDELEAKMLCDTLNQKCSNAGNMDLDEIMAFSDTNCLNLNKSMISEIDRIGSYFKYEEVPFKHFIDYSIFEADWDSSNFDACSSDAYYYHDWYIDPDYHHDYDMGCNYNVDLKHINQHKLEKFNVESNKYKRYDPKYAHPDVANRFAWYDPIHKFCHNHGFAVEFNVAQCIIKKCVDRKASTALWKIKNHPRYKHSATFRMGAEWLIEALLGKSPSWCDYLEDLGLKIEDGYLRKKDETENLFGGLRRFS